MHRLILLFLSFTLVTQARSEDTIRYISLEKFRDGIKHWNLFSPIHNYDRYDSTDIAHIADNLLAWQNSDGGWPKNIDWLGMLDADSIKSTLSERQRESTFDNRNIFPQVEYLAKSYKIYKDKKYQEGAEKGLRYILNNQGPTGGWRGADVDAITFNDDVMTGIMNLLLDIQYDRITYDWIEPALKNKLYQAYKKALSATLKCQVEIHGKKTAWCQQHDHSSYKPVKARSYELPSVTARESTDVVLMLMKIRDPGDSVIQAVESAIQWLKAVEIEGFRYATVPIPEVKYYETTVDYDRVLIADSTAGPVWARYYDLEQSEPFLCRRDGRIVYSLDEISFERRVGYAWYGYWPEKALEAYEKWKMETGMKR